MSEKPLIVLADHHEYVRNVLSDFLSEKLKANLFKVGNGEDCLKLVAQHPVDLVISEVYMPVMNGIELTTMIRQQYPDTKVIALSMLDDKLTILKMIGAGVSAYVLKEGNLEELVIALEHVQNDRKYFSPLIANGILDGFPHERLAYVMKDLTEIKYEALRLILIEKTDHEIAVTLRIRESKVWSIRAEFYDQMKVDNVADLVQIAIRERWFDHKFF